jgi:hypothetical protein
MKFFVSIALFLATVAIVFTPRSAARSFLRGTHPVAAVEYKDAASKQSLRGVHQEMDITPLIRRKQLR